jgi:AMP phosphorylase
MNSLENNMKLKAKKLRWLAGRPVVILSTGSAKNLNVTVNERIGIRYKKKLIYAVVDIFSDLVKNDEIGLSQEIINFLPLKDNSYLEIFPADSFLAGQIIKKKLLGGRLTDEEIKILITEISQNNLTESEIAFFVSAERNNGMNKKELISLTKAMIQTGNKLEMNKKIIADKHCIGGIAGNRTTPLVVSICSAAGLTMPKTSSRAITSAAGTADTVETIARVDFNQKELMKVVNGAGACLVWNGALNLSPSDDKIIRVERLLNLDVEPQLIASIMSKKISAGSNRILIDIPYGGGKINNLKKAKELGNKFIQVGNYFKVRVKPVYTSGNQPIGKGIGPVLEMIDIIDILKGDGPEDLKEKSIFLAGKILEMCGLRNGEVKAREILESGKAYLKFKEIINLQNGKNDFDERIKKLKLGKYSKTFIAKKDRQIKHIDNKKINLLCRILGAPETKTAGVYLHKGLGRIFPGEKIITLYSESEDKLKDSLKYFEEFEPILIR